MYVFTGNLSSDITEEDLRKEFTAFGEVSFVNIVKNRLGSVSRGFGILGMPVTSEGEAAIRGMHGKELKGTILVVNQVRPRTLGDSAPVKAE